MASAPRALATWSSGSAPIARVPAEIMSTGLPSVRPDATIEHCMQLMSDKNIRYLPVFENEMLAGIISMSDVVKQTILEQQETINHLESYIHSGR